MSAPDLEQIRERLAAHEPAHLSDDTTRSAAVAAILREPEGGSTPEVLLIRRARSAHDPWSGHMAFPGGRKDPDDPDLLHTVWRETLEEVSIDLRRQARLLGRIDDVEAIARGKRVGMVITPYVFELVEHVEPHPNYEVEEALWASLDPMLQGHVATTRPYEYEGSRYDLPAFDVGGRVVWGLTYQMLQSFFATIRR